MPSPKPEFDNVRYTAIHVIKAVIDQHKSMTSLLEQHRSDVPPRQQAFLFELSYGSVRWYIKLEFWLNKLLSKPLKNKDRDIHFTLILGLFQLAYLDKPQHAVINETVKLSKKFHKPWASALINGVLRNFVRQQARLQATNCHDYALQHALPAWLVEELKLAYPKDYIDLLSSLNERAPMAIRVNTKRLTKAQYLGQLSGVGLSARESVVANTALILNQPCDVSSLPGFFEGACSVQDEAAQLAASILVPTANQSVLDACSAPGGKTCAMLEANESIKLLALDADAERQQLTKDNLKRLNLMAEIRHADAGDPYSWWDGDPFDHILLDAPCSATGVIRRHPDIKHLRKPNDIDRLSELQNKLLTKLWSTLKPGGTLLYATCSLLPQENTQLIKCFIKKQRDAQAMAMKIQGDVNTEYGCQLLPKSGGYDGFYYCLLKKTT